MVQVHVLLHLVQFKLWSSVFLQAGIRGWQEFKSTSLSLPAVVHHIERGVNSCGFNDHWVTIVLNPALSFPLDIEPSAENGFVFTMCIICTDQLRIIELCPEQEAFARLLKSVGRIAVMSGGGNNFALMVDNDPPSPPSNCPPPIPPQQYYWE